jgi:hypothetical protein
MCDAVRRIEEIYATYASGGKDAACALEELHEIIAAAHVVTGVIISRIAESCCAEGIRPDAHACALTEKPTLTLEV